MPTCPQPKHPKKVLSLFIALVVVLGACGGATEAVGCESRDAGACDGPRCFLFRGSLTKRLTPGAPLCRTRCVDTCSAGTCRTVVYVEEVGGAVTPINELERVCLSDGELLW